MWAGHKTSLYFSDYWLSDEQRGVLFHLLVSTVLEN